MSISYLLACSKVSLDPPLGGITKANTALESQPHMIMCPYTFINHHLHIFTKKTVMWIKIK